MGRDVSTGSGRGFVRDSVVVDASLAPGAAPGLEPFGNADVGGAERAGDARTAALAAAEAALALAVAGDPSASELASRRTR